METNWNQLIERYLNNELSAEGKQAFEAALKENQDLQKEFELHKLTTEIIQRDSLRTLVKASGKWFHLKKMMVNSGMVLVIAAVLASALYFFAILSKDTAGKTNEPQILEQSLLNRLEQTLAFENVDPEYFRFTGESDVFLSASGVLLSITDESFLLDGKPYTGEAIIQWQEAQQASDIVKAGLSTKSGDQLLETQGMFSLNAFTPEGKKLQLTDQGVYVQVPVDELKKDMKLFTGVPGKDGQIDWQHPVELERLPKPKDMSRIDLFPPRYEPKLNELKWFREKSKRDSLYLSFEEGAPLKDSTATSIDEIQMYTQPQMETPKKISEAPYPSGATQISMIIPPKPQDNLNGKQKLVPSGQTGVELSEDKVHWSFNVRYVGNNEAEIIATVVIKTPWHINALYLPKGTFGIATSLKLKENPNFKLIGKPSEPKPILSHDDKVDEDLAYHTGGVQFKQKIRLTGQIPFELKGTYLYQACNESHCLPPFNGTLSLEINGAGSSKSHIPPSKVLAIWKKQFNGTNLATQDFEDRMKEIHNTCDENVFDVYAKNLNEPLWKLDQRVVQMGYPQFQRFADQKVGKLNLDAAHQRNLETFYERAVKEIRARGKQEAEMALKKERSWDAALEKERNQEVLRRGLRESANLNEEYGFNLRNVYKQLGVTAGFQLHGGGTIVNIDKYVWDATVARQSTLITDPQTGKTAQITYEPLTVQLKNALQYDKLFLYLFSKEINSYQRLDFKDGKLDYNLNGDMHYRAALVGMNEKGFFYYQIKELKAADWGTISLEAISEKDLDNRINALNTKRVENPMSLKEELNWLFKEKANYKVVRKRRENEQFRNTIRPTIYACERDVSRAVSDTIAIK